MPGDTAERAPRKGVSERTVQAVAAKCTKCPSNESTNHCCVDRPISGLTNNRSYGRWPAALPLTHDAERPGKVDGRFRVQRGAGGNAADQEGREINHELSWTEANRERMCWTATSAEV